MFVSFFKNIVNSHLCGVIHLNMGNLPVVTLLRRVALPTPVAIKCHYLSARGITCHSSFHSRIFNSLDNVGA